jgi:hypothetical protein
MEKIAIVVGFIATFALVSVCLLRVSLWFQKVAWRKEFWDFFDCWHLVGELDWRKKVALIVKERLLKLKKQVDFLKKELAILDQKLLIFESEGDYFDEGSEEDVLYRVGLSNLSEEIIDRRSSVLAVEQKFLRACFLAGFMDFKEEVQACQCQS